VLVINCRRGHPQRPYCGVRRQRIASGGRPRFSRERAAWASPACDATEAVGIKPAQDFNRAWRSLGMSCTTVVRPIRRNR
jgi:hypothetical protein